MLQTFLWKSDCLFELDEDKNINIKNERDKLQNVVHDSLWGNSGWYLVPMILNIRWKQSGSITAMLLSLLWTGKLILTNIFLDYSRKYWDIDFSFEYKFCKHFVTLRKSFEVFVSFNIDQCLLNRTDKISNSLFYDKNLDIEKEKKIFRPIWSNVVGKSLVKLRICYFAYAAYVICYLTETSHMLLALNSDDWLTRPVTLLLTNKKGKWPNPTSTLQNFSWFNNASCILLLFITFLYFLYFSFCIS